eukprot:TRINITY_DN909_c1_g1_i1.p1 TRINITY_DN909_c1_g1~~TRINITY_DN909_c1_g1_i1.p1  ORF type:complete len:111 (-),score=18.01 TRINITY_DN909_c1_g1_i1:97-429(-)
MAMRSRSTLAVTFALAALALLAARCAFVGPAGSPAVQTRAEALDTATVQNSQSTLALGASAGFLAAAPQSAHALLLQDEILPISFAVIGATLWGIVLGFVLLRLQEAFPE